MAAHEQLTAALEVVVNIARCIALKRALAATDPDPALTFWRVIHGNLLDVAVLDWCKLFGSDDEEHQQVHWKNVFADKTTFRAGLLAHVQMNENSWCDYWKKMKKYRDQHVAHRDLNRRDVTHYPDLDAALSSVFYYHSSLIAELHMLGELRYPDDLITYYEKLLEQASEIAKTATASTSRFAG